MSLRDIGTFGIKLVGGRHREFPFFGPQGKPSLMNFPDSREGRRVAAGIPVGHRSLVYQMHPEKRFWSAVEYVKWDPSTQDVLEEGTQAAVAQGAIALMEAYSPIYARVWRCIRFLAVIDDHMNGPALNLGFHAGDVMREISQQVYLEYFNAVPWSWTA